MDVSESQKRSLISVSSNVLDMHLSELAEECARFVALLEALRCMAVPVDSANDEVREWTEANLYTSLSHLSHHVQPALDEWDRLDDELPDDDEDSTE